MDVDKIYNEDCLEGMKNIDNNYVDCIITSPPYNVGLAYDGYNDNREYNEYLSFMGDVFKESYRLLCDGGRMCINIGDGKNGSISTHSDFIQICKNIGFNVMTTIVWNKNTTSNRTSWGSFMSPSCPSFPRGFEYILIFSKGKKLQKTGVSTITKENFIKWSNGLWVFAPESLKKIGHPAAFPLELPMRCIEMLTYKDAVVLDSFMGSGTTAIACIKGNRHFIGFELNMKYCEIACKRIKEVQSQPTLFT